MGVGADYLEATGLLFSWTVTLPSTIYHSVVGRTKHRTLPVSNNRAYLGPITTRSVNSQPPMYNKKLVPPSVNMPPGASTLLMSSG